MSNIEQTNIPDPLVGPIVAPKVPEADQKPAEPVGENAEKNIANGVNPDEKAQLVSGTLLPVAEVPVDIQQGGDSTTAADGIHHTEAKAKALMEASKAQSAQAKKTKAAANNKLHQGTATAKAGSSAKGGNNSAACPVGGEAQLNMIFSQLNGLAVKFEKFAKAQDAMLGHVEVVRDEVEKIVPHVIEEEDTDYTDDDEESVDEDSEEDSEDDSEEEEEEEEEAPVVVQKSVKRKNKGKQNGQSAKKQQIADDDVEEISDREVEEGEDAVSRK